MRGKAKMFWSCEGKYFDLLSALDMLILNLHTEHYRLINLMD